MMTDRRRRRRRNSRFAVARSPKAYPCVNAVVSVINVPNTQVYDFM